MQKIITMFYSVMVGLIVIGVISQIIGVHYSVGEGSHNGIITAKEKTGVFFKTYNVYLKTSTQSSQEDKYCTSKEVYDSLPTEFSSSIPVTVEYVSYLSNGITTCDGSSDFILKVISK